MDGPASPAELPAWQACLGAFQVRVRRPEGRDALERDTTGRLTARPHKHGDTSAQAVPGTSAQRVQECLTHRPWAAADLNRQRVQTMVAAAARGAGGVVCDETGVPTQGKASVGVARQDAGTLGQVGHGQMAVTCCDSDPQATWPVAGRWSLPKTWADDPKRRQPTRVPEAIPLRTTPEMALMLLEQARAWGVPHRGVVAAADDGETPHCLAGVEARQAPSVVAVRTDVAVRLRQAATSRRWRADAVRHPVPRWQWRTMRWRPGTHGGWRKTCGVVRCWRVTRTGYHHEGWLGGERAPQGPPEERQYCWSHLPAETTREELAGLAHRRHAIAQVHEEATGELGWDQDQGRLGPGVPRHAVTVRLADSLLGWLAQRQRQRHTRQGRPRDPCSPAAAGAAQDPAGGAS